MREMLLNVILSTYSRGYKKRAIAEKMFGNLAIFSDSLQGYFSTFFFFFCYQRTANLHMESFFWTFITKRPPKKSAKLDLF